MKTHVNKYKNRRKGASICSICFINSEFLIFEEKKTMKLVIVVFYIAFEIINCYQQNRVTQNVRTYRPKNAITIFSTAVDDSRQTSTNRFMIKDSFVEKLLLSNRGQTKDEALLFGISKLLLNLESKNPTLESSSSALLLGDWKLLYCNDDPTRASPFFWAFRKVSPFKFNLYY